MKKLISCFICILAFSILTPAYAKDGDKIEKKEKKEKKAKGKKVELTGKLTKNDEGSYTLTEGDTSYTLKFSKKILKTAEGLVDKDVSISGTKIKKGENEVIMVTKISE